MREEGMVLVFVLFLITALLILGTAVVKIINNDLLITGYNQERIKAGYRAEAGIAEAIYTMRCSSELEETELKEKLLLISGFSAGEKAGYEIVEVITPGEQANQSGDYLVTSLGRAGKTEISVKALITSEEFTLAQLVISPEPE